jgi:type I restriction enzyme, S subunit
VPNKRNIIKHGEPQFNKISIPNEWSIVNFSDCHIKKKGKMPHHINTSDYHLLGKFPIVDQSTNYIAGYTDDETKIFKDSLPVIVFGDHTRIFKFVDYPFAIGAQGTKIFIPNQDLFDPQFLFFILSKLDIPNRGYNRHSKLLNEYSIVKPPLPEQRAIAATLSTVQEAKEKTDAVIAATKALKAAMMKHLFTYGLVPPEEADRVALKETEIGQVPHGWDIKKVGDYCLSSVFGPRFSNRLYDEKGNIALLRTTDIDTDGTISYSTMPRANLEIAQFKNHFLLPNDLVITRSGTCGIAAVFSNYEIPVLPGAFLIRFRLSNDIDPIFLKYYINSEAGQSRISQLAEGAIQKNLSGKKILNFYIPVPSQKIQNQILAILSTVDQKLAAEESRREALDTLFTTLLHDLMTAKIRVNPAETA